MNGPFIEPIEANFVLPYIVYKVWKNREEYKQLKEIYKTHYDLKRPSNCYSYASIC